MNGLLALRQSGAVVVGGGVMGLLTARFLLAERVDVCLIDSGEPGRSASWAGGGILSPLRPWLYPAAVAELVRRSVVLYAELAETLKREVDIDIEMVRSGMLYLEQDPGPALTWAKTEGHDCRVVEGASVAAEQPGISSRGQAVLFPDVHQVRNPRLLKALIASLPAAGGRLVSNAKTSIHVRKGKAAFARDGETPQFERHYVVSAGAWTPELLGPTGQIAIRPVRGQMLCVQAKPGLLKRIVMKGDHYLIPRRDGRILIGSTLEEVGFDARTTEAARDELWTAALGIMPGLRDFPIDAQWSGLRPGSPTGIPYIGRHPHFENVWVCAGHYRNGLTMAPASAELLCALMCGKRPRIDPAPYAVATS